MEKVVPKLRFPEFDVNWTNFTLKDISEKIKDGTHFSPKTFKNGDYKYLTSKNIKNGYLDFSNLEFINKKDHDKIYSSSDVKYGDILLTKDGTIGQCCINTLDEEFSLLSSVAFIRLKDNFSNYFIYQLFVSNKGQREIEKAIAGQALKRITLTKINDFKFNIPHLAEQQKIASFLTSVDERLTLLAQQKEKLELYKKGVMQQIFSQKLRFKDENGKNYPDWEEKKLGEIGNTFNGLTGKTKEHFGNGKPYIQYMQIFNGSKININDFGFVEIGENENQSKVQYGDVFFTTSSETPNEIGTTSILLNEVVEVYLNSFCFGFRPNSLNELVPEFAQFLFRSKQMRDKIVPLAQGSTRFNMSKVELMKLDVLLPCEKEQQKIASFLSAIDFQIEGVSKKIEQTKLFKKGLLQQMFV